MNFIYGFLVSSLFWLLLTPVIVTQNSSFASTPSLIMIQDTISIEKAYTYLKSIGVKYPDVVVAQMCLETTVDGIPFQSDLAKRNNFLGMMPSDRGYSKKTEGKRFAHFTSWKTCLHDYKELQYKFYWNVKSEAKYIDQLCLRYAPKQENPHYKQSLYSWLKKVRKVLNIKGSR